jgi:hypothetical protein
VTDRARDHADGPRGHRGFGHRAREIVVRPLGDEEQSHQARHQEAQRTDQDPGPLHVEPRQPVEPREPHAQPDEREAQRADPEPHLQQVADRRTERTGEPAG